MAPKAAMEEAAALRQEIKRRRSTGPGRLGRLARAWEDEQAGRGRRLTNPKACTRNRRRCHASAWPDLL